MREPVRIVAGDSVEWQRDLFLYPATDWVLHYAFQPERGGAVVNVSGVADVALPERHVVSMSGEVSATLAAGTYRLRGWVKSKTGEQRWTLEECSTWLEVLANPDQAVAADSRTDAKRRLEAIDLAITELANRRVVETTVNGDTYRLQDLDQLGRLRKQYAEIVAREEEAAAFGGGPQAIQFIIG